jgi:lipopolysaccharide heptosyltransferase III
MPRRLIIRPGAIGDFIVSLPALEFLRDDYTELWTSTATTPLGRFADRVRSISSVGLDRMAVTHDDDVIDRLRQFDSIHSWYGARHQAFRDRVSQLNLPFTFYEALPQGPLHAVDFYLNQVGAPLGAKPHIECRLQRRKELAVIHPFASNFQKRWPIESFQQLAAKLEQHGHVQWCRGPEETLDHAYYLENLYELGAWLASAAVYIGNDSGISHLAAAVGTPVLAFFGPTDPLIWSPRGERVTLFTLDSTAEEVYPLAAKLLLAC